MSLAALVGLTTVGLAAVPAVAGAGGNPTPVVVTPASLVTYPTLPTQGQFVAIDQSGGSGGGGVSIVSNGPTSSQGSLQMSTTGSGSHWSVYNEDWAGTLLSNLTSLSYTTNTNDSSNVLDPTLQLVINPGNTTSGPDQGVTYSTVNFEPYNQSTPVVNGTWQTWDVTSGVVWGSHLTGAPQSGPISWSTFLSDYPNAVILGASAGGGVGVNVGSGWGAVTGNVGDFTIGTSAGATTYTFDTSAPTTATSTTPASSSIVLGNSNSDSATVTGNPVVGSPTGSVQFSKCGPTSTPTPCTSGTPVGGPVTLTAGADNTATAQSPSFTPTGTGYWCFAGYYSGDSNYAASTDTTVDECFQVTQASSSTVTVPTTSSEVYGSGPIYDTATVTGTTAAYPTGGVQFYICGPLSSAGTCSSSTGTPLSLDQTSEGSSSTGIANSVGFTPPTAGSWCFSAYYLGDSNYSASQDATTDECVNVRLAPTSVKSIPTNSTITLGQSNTDAATVSTGGNPAGSPTGTVAFYECGPTSTPTPCTSIAHPIDGPVTVTARSGSTASATSVSFKPNAVGYWCFSARYSGDTGYARSSDTSVGECVDVKGPVAIVTTSLPQGTKGHGYSATVVARGGTTPYVWANSALPKGITFNHSTGVFSGAPQVSGSFPISIKVRDSSKPSGTATRTFTLVINP